MAHEVHVTSGSHFGNKLNVAYMHYNQILHSKYEDLPWKYHYL